MQHLIHTKNEDNFLIQTLVSRWPWDAENPFPDHVSQAVKDAIWTYSRRRLTMLRIPTGSSQPYFEYAYPSQTTHPTIAPQMT